MSMIGNTVAPGQTIQISLPHLTSSQPLISSSVAWWDPGTSEWNIAQSAPPDQGQEGTVTASGNLRLKEPYVLPKGHWAPDKTLVK
jgi:hypothetical protein